MFNWLDSRKDIGLLILRFFVGIRLFYGVVDNILSWAHMKEFEVFLAGQNFPIPLVSAVVSVYAQALAGILFVIGWQVRWVAIVMTINFLIATLMVHWGQSFEQMTTVLFMIISSVTLFFTGAGKYSIDERKSPLIEEPMNKRRSFPLK